MHKRRVGVKRHGCRDRRWNPKVNIALLFNFSTAVSIGVTIDAVGIVDERVEDGVGIGRIADRVVPALELRGDSMRCRKPDMPGDEKN